MNEHIAITSMIMFVLCGSIFLVWYSTRKSRKEQATQRRAREQAQREARQAQREAQKKEFDFWNKTGRLVRYGNVSLISYFSENMKCGDNVLVGSTLFVVSAVGKKTVEAMDDTGGVLKTAIKDGRWYLVQSFNGDTLFSDVPAIQVCSKDSPIGRELYRQEKRKQGIV